jgi:hypothetical protein
MRISTMNERIRFITMFQYEEIRSKDFFTDISIWRNSEQEKNKQIKKNKKKIFFTNILKPYSRRINYNI